MSDIKIERGEKSDRRRISGTWFVSDGRNLSVGGRRSDGGRVNYKKTKVIIRRE